MQKFTHNVIVINKAQLISAIKNLEEQFESTKIINGTTTYKFKGGVHGMPSYKVKSIVASIRQYPDSYFEVN